MSEQKKRSKVFVKTWLAKFSWLEKRHDKGKKCDRAFCKVCNGWLTNGLKDLLMHEKTSKHQENVNVMAASVKEQECIANFIGQDEQRQKAIFELRVCMLVADTDSSIKIVDKLIPTVKASFPNVPALSKVRLAKQKAGNIIRGNSALFQTISFIEISFVLAIGEFFTKKLIEVLNKSYWSIVIDETTDISVETKLAIVLQYWDPQSFKVIVSTLELAECTDGTADGNEKL